MTRLADLCLHKVREKIDKPCSVGGAPDEGAFIRRGIGKCGAVLDGPGVRTRGGRGHNYSRAALRFHEPLRCLGHGRNLQFIFRYLLAQTAGGKYRRATSLDSRLSRCQGCSLHIFYMRNGLTVWFQVLLVLLQKHQHQLKNQPVKSNL